jgi:hypothetical protein
MLTCHPRIAVPPECGFAVQLARTHGGFRGGGAAIDAFVADLVATPKFEHWKLSREVVRDHVRERAPTGYADLVASVYACYAKVHQGGKPRWGDKNNFHLDHIDAIASLFPDAVFVHIVRDPRDVACSYRSLEGVKGRYAPTLPTDAFVAARDWARNLEKIRRSFARIERARVHELRYEDLVANPEAELRRLCAFLDEPYAPEMLAYDRENRARELEPREFDAWKVRNREAVDASAVGRWREQLSREETAWVERAAGSLLTVYGYTSAGYGDVGFLRGAARSLRYDAAAWVKRVRAKLRRSRA